jgi:predicted nucleic acid-binding protein
MSLVVLDTDVSSLIHKRRLPVWLERQVAPEDMCVSFVTVGELAKWAEVRSWGSQSRARLGDWLQEVVVLPSNARVSHTWGRLAARAQRRGRPRPANDMWIAACALVYGLPLATLNVKDFADFVEYDGLRLLRLYPQSCGGSITGSRQFGRNGCRRGRTRRVRQPTVEPTRGRASQRH